MKKTVKTDRGMDTDRFSLDSYGEMLRKAKRSGYRFPKLPGFKDWMGKYRKFLLLRHDVDLSPLNALEMAKVEHSLGVVSTYYVLLRSVFYNPAAEPFFKAFKKIIAMGHDIGLHYDCGFYEENGMDIGRGIIKDADALQNILGVKIRSVAQHKPAVRKGIYKPPSIYVDAYDEILLNKARYISESGFKWRGETLADIVGRRPKIYALIHPDIWAHSRSDMAASYRKTTKLSMRLIEDECSDFINSTNEYLKKRAKKEIM